MNSRCLVATLLLLAAVPCLGAGTLPVRLDDGAFWKLISTLSEQGGTFQSDNLLSNETDFPFVMEELQQKVKPGGVYLGVGPEQSFNYIAATQPGMAFIIDIRRDNMLQHFMYKALFELSPDRASFVSRLFSIRRPADLRSEMTAAELFDAYADRPADSALFQTNFKEIEAVIVRKHQIPLSEEDRSRIEQIYSVFSRFGPLINYNSFGGFGGRRFMPSYAELMTATDHDGREWSYLASETSYRVVRDLQLRNLIVPLTGDFGGPQAIRGVAKYLKEHGVVVSAFYTSNVEGYLFRGGDRQGNPNGGVQNFFVNVATLPLDDASTFIRWLPNLGRNYGPPSIVLAPVRANIEAFQEGRFTDADSITGFSLGARPAGLNDSYRRAPTQRSLWLARLRIPFYASWALAAFSIRFLFWRSDEQGGMVFARRLLASCAWGLVGFGIAATLAYLAGV